MSALPKGSLVLVTGANGWIGSHIVDQLLQAGYSVRGSVREDSKAAWLKEYVADKYGAGRFEVVVVPDMSTDGAFDEAVKGVSAFIHVASDVSFSTDAEKVINGVVRGVEIALAAAASQPSVKHFVYTSSSAAVGLPELSVPITYGADTWNEESAAIAWDVKSEDPFRGGHIYSTSKMEGEKAVLRFAEKQDMTTGMVVNTVVPNMNWGPLLSPKQEKLSSGAFIPGIYEQGLDATWIFKDYPPQYHIDVRDTARLHVAPLLDPEIRGERLFAMNELYDWEKVLKILHELRPEWKNDEVFKETRVNMSVVGLRPRTEEVLRKNFGQAGLTSMRDSIEANIAHLP